MKSNTKRLLRGGLLGLIAVSTPVLSRDAGWYAGLSYGQSTFKGSCDEIVGPGISCDEKDAAFKRFGGYQVDQFLGVEMGYAHLGKTAASFEGFGDASIATKGYELLVVGTVPIDQQWSVYAKVGFFRWNVDLKDETGILGSVSATGTDLTYAGGVKYNFTRNFALHAEYQRYNNVGDANTTGNGLVSLMSGGVIVRF